MAILNQTFDNFFDRVFADLARGYTASAVCCDEEAPSPEPRPVLEVKAERPPLEPYAPTFFVWSQRVYDLDGLLLHERAMRSGPFHCRDLAEEVAADFCAKPGVIWATVDSY